MYFHHEATHRGAVAGSRHVIGPVFFDGPGPDGLAWEERLANLRAWPTLLDEIGGPRVPVAAMPHATYTCSPEGLAEVVAVLREVLAAGDRPGMVTTHVSENLAENAGMLERYEATPTRAARAQRLGRARPPPRRRARRAPQRARLQGPGRRGSRGRPLPRVEPQARERRARVGAVRDSGIRLGIGTDGCSRLNDLDMWQAMRQAALLARLTSGRPDVASATEVLRAATIEGRPGPWASVTRSGRSRWASGPTSCSSTSLPRT